MRHFIVVLLVLLLSSCDKTTTEVRILLLNATNLELDVKLYPNEKFLNSGGDSYKFSAIGSGSGANEFVLGAHDSSKYSQSEVLYYTNALSVSATDLAKQVFDSIHIVFSNGQESMIRFLHSSVSGYARNLFTDEESWNYELNNYDEPVGLSTTHVEAHEYTFKISEEKIVQYVIKSIIGV